MAVRTQQPDVAVTVSCSLACVFSAAQHCCWGVSQQTQQPVAQRVAHATAHFCNSLCSAAIFFGMRAKCSVICHKLAQYKRSTHTSPMPTFKTQAVSVRVQPHIKAALQTAAERELRSLANMVEVMVVEYCRAHDFPLDGVPSETLPSAQRRKTP